MAELGRTRQKTGRKGRNGQNRDRIVHVNNDHLSLGLPPPFCPRVFGLIRPHGNLCIPLPVHTPLVDVGTAYEYVLVVHYHHLGMDVNHLTTRGSSAGRGGGRRGRRRERGGAGRGEGVRSEADVSDTSDVCFFVFFVDRCEIVCGFGLESDLFGFDENTRKFTLRSCLSAVGLIDFSFLQGI